MTTGPFDSQAQQQISRVLEPKERLIWAGVPKRGLLVLRKSDALRILFGLFCCYLMLVIFWNAAVMIGGAPIDFVLLVWPFTFIWWLFVGPFFWNASARAETIYGLTNYRAIIVSGRVKKRTSSVLLRQLSDISVWTRANGDGTIRLGRAFSWWGAHRAWPPLDPHMPPRFEKIPDAQHVYEFILKAQREAVEDKRQRVGLR